MGRRVQKQDPGVRLRCFLCSQPCYEPQQKQQHRKNCNFTTSCFLQGGMKRENTQLCHLCVGRRIDPPHFIAEKISALSVSFGYSIVSSWGNESTCKRVSRSRGRRMERGKWKGNKIDNMDDKRGGQKRSLENREKTQKMIGKELRKQDGLTEENKNHVVTLRERQRRTREHQRDHSLCFFGVVVFLH